MSQPKINWYKWGIIIVAIIAIFFLGRSCGIKSVVKITHIDTTIKKDSIVFQDRPVPYKVTHDSLIYVKGKPVILQVHDTLEPLVDPTDTAAILARFYGTAYYDTTYELQRGIARIIDTVTQNRISGRQVKVTGTDTTIKETVIIKPPQRLILYWGGSVLGNPNNIVYGIGTDLSLKTTDDMIYGIGVKWMNEHKMFYELQVKFPLKLKK